MDDIIIKIHPFDEELGLRRNHLDGFAKWIDMPETIWNSFSPRQTSIFQEILRESNTCSKTGLDLTPNSVVIFIITLCGQISSIVPADGVLAVQVAIRTGLLHGTVQILILFYMVIQVRESMMVL